MRVSVGCFEGFGVRDLAPTFGGPGLGGVRGGFVSRKMLQGTGEPSFWLGNKNTDFLLSYLGFSVCGLAA